MTLTRHSAGTREGGRFKAAEAPALAADPAPLTLGDGRPVTVVDRIRNLGVEVRWAEDGWGEWKSAPATPALGVLAGLPVAAWVLPQTVRRHRWRCYVEIGSVPYRGTSHIEITPPVGKTWATDDRAKAAAASLLRGGGEGLRWHPRFGDMRWHALPMDQLRGWLNR